jgi:hypothetical protein
VVAVAAEVEAVVEVFVKVFTARPVVGLFATFAVLLINDVMLTSASVHTMP